MTKFPIERVVTIVTPFFAAGAATLAAWLSTKVGVHVNSGDVEGVMAAAFLGTTGIVYKWLHGRQIPAIAGLGLSEAQVDQVREEVAHHLAAVAPQAEIDIEAIANKILERAAGSSSVVGTPAAAVAPPQ